MTILLVEDDAALGAQIRDTLDKAGYAVQWLQDGDEARQILPDDYELIVLDLMLPGTYGMDLLKLYRRTSEVPALILSARSDTFDKVRALELGADDYLTKPFWPEELLARVGARLRRPNLKRDNTLLTVGAIHLDADARTVQITGDIPQTVELTAAEFDILHTLMQRAGSALTRDALVDAALDPGKDGGRRTLDVHVSRLRKKLGGAGGQLTTVWGIGYKLVESAP